MLGVQCIVYPSASRIKLLLSFNSDKCGAMHVHIPNIDLVISICLFGKKRFIWCSSEVTKRESNRSQDNCGADAFNMHANGALVLTNQIIFVLWFKLAVDSTIRRRNSIIKYKEDSGSSMRGTESCYLDKIQQKMLFMTTVTFSERNNSVRIDQLPVSSAIVVTFNLLFWACHIS